MVIIRETNAPQLYVEALQKMRVMGMPEPSRAGDVLTIPGPVLLEMTHPEERVLFDPVRDCNHAFHVMEFVWMMAGRRDSKWLEQFNSRYGEYADNGRVNGAYGYRWRIHHMRHNHHVDQITEVVEVLRRDPNTRQAVISMWDPCMDLGTNYKDRPCNTHIYFRQNRGGELDMTVCNRSNDLIWGMLGANIVHMTLLHQLICEAANLPMGVYRVFTNNLHIYKSLPKYEQIMQTVAPHDMVYYDGEYEPYPLLGGMSLESFLDDCERFCRGESYSNIWLSAVADPMKWAYLDRPNRGLYIQEIKDEAWRTAMIDWTYRRLAVQQMEA